MPVTWHLILTKLWTIPHTPWITVQKHKNRLKDAHNFKNLIYLWVSVLRGSREFPGFLPIKPNLEQMQITVCPRIMFYFYLNGLTVDRLRRLIYSLLHRYYLLVRSESSEFGDAE